MEEIVDEATSNETFLKTAAKVAKSGFALLGKAALQARLAACEACALSTKAERAVTCGVCGCDMTIKARFAATECPINPDW